MTSPTVVDRCRGWDSADCEGTPSCPPRCPRFVDGSGVPLLCLPFTDAPVDRDSLLALYDSTDARGSLSYPPYATHQSIASWLDGLLAEGWNVVVVDDDRPVGHAVLTPSDAAEPEFGVYVDPAHRGRGLASELLRQCVAHAIAEGYRGVVMVVERENGAMQAIARDHGFEVVESSERDDWIEFVSFRLSFDPSAAPHEGGLVSLPV